MTTLSLLMVFALLLGAGIDRIVSSIQVQVAKTDAEFWHERYRACLEELMRREITALDQFGGSEV